MKTGIEITNEPNPFLREIYGAGYDSIEKDWVSFKLKLFKEGQIVKSIDLRDYMSCVNSCSIYVGANDWGHTMAFISNASGCLAKFIKLISE